LKKNPKLETFRGNREIILKARQMGFTTFIAGRIFVDTANVPNTQSMMIAQDETNAKNLFALVKRFNDTLPPHLKRKIGTDSATKLEFEDINSSFTVGWAGSAKVGRGGTLNNVHLSEVAFYNNAGPVIAGLLESVPEDGNIFLESTANGVGNYYFVEYKAAEEGNSIYSDRFFPWFIEPTYAKPFEEEQIWEPTDDEKKLLEFYPDLSPEQLNWRRNKILALRNSKRDGSSEEGDFPQEYPMNAQEAFLTSGQGYFDNGFIDKELVPVALDSEKLTIEVPRKYPELYLETKRSRVSLSIFSLPAIGHRYLLSADPSEGLNDKGDPDSCSTDVIDSETMEQVATLHGRWEPYDYAVLISQLGYWYNSALIAVERNNHGHSVLNTLINVIGYDNIYYHTDYEAKVNSRVRKPGFHTNVKTKSMALAALFEMSMDGSLIIRQIKTLEEMKNYSKLPGNKFGAIIGHDDRVMSVAIACYILKDKIAIKKYLSKEKQKATKIKFRMGSSRSFV